MTQRYFFLLECWKRTYAQRVEKGEEKGEGGGGGAKNQKKKKLCGITKSIVLEYTSFSHFSWTKTNLKALVSDHIFSIACAKRIDVLSSR